MPNDCMSGMQNLFLGGGVSPILADQTKSQNGMYNAPGTQ